jgi:hypothetical protein
VAAFVVGGEDLFRGAALGQQLPSRFPVPRNFDTIARAAGCRWFALQKAVLTERAIEPGIALLILHLLD